MTRGLMKLIELNKLIKRINPKEVTNYSNKLNELQKLEGQVKFGWISEKSVIELFSESEKLGILNLIEDIQKENFYDDLNPSQNEPKYGTNLKGLKLINGKHPIGCVASEVKGEEINIQWLHFSHNLGEKYRYYRDTIIQESISKERLVELKQDNEFKLWYDQLNPYQQQAFNLRTENKTWFLGLEGDQKPLDLGKHEYEGELLLQEVSRVTISQTIKVNDSGDFNLPTHLVFRR